MAWDALAGQSLAPERLRFAQVETSTRCNYRCPYCQITYSARPRRVMSLEEFRTIIEQLAELPAVRKFYLNGYNEPSLVPEIVEQIQLAARPLYARLDMTPRKRNGRHKHEIPTSGPQAFVRACG